MRRLHIACTIAALGLAGCTTPRAAPLANEVRAGSAAAGIPLHLLSTAVAAQSGPAPTETFDSEFTQAAEIDPAILDVGDRLTATIWDGGGNGLSVATLVGGKLDLPDLPIGADGTIDIPYAGRINAAGRTVAAVRAAILTTLERKVFRPQVEVRLVEQPGRVVTIQGNVERSGSHMLRRGFTRIGTLVAAAGTSAEHPEQLRVELRRGDRIARARLADILADPLQNIALRAGDAVIVTRQIEHVIVIGAAGQQGRVEIVGRYFSLLDAIASARGLDDQVADPKAVFLLRGVPGGTPATAPVIYQVDIRDPAAVMLAARFHLRDGDVIIASNAGFAQTLKVLTAVGSGLSFVRATGMVR